MFIQVIQGKISDRKAMEKRVRDWTKQLAPGARGWLGMTGGVTDDGTYIGIVRFASETDARRNSDRPEQGKWWAESAKLFEDKATFHDCADVQVLLSGGSDDAGFVQVMQGRTRDIDRLKSLTTRMEPVLTKHRPDVIGITVAYADDGTCTQTVYFTSESEARKNERKDLPADVGRLIEEERDLLKDLTYYDLRKPLLLSPR